MREDAGSGRPTTARRVVKDDARAGNAIQRIDELPVFEELGSRDWGRGFDQLVNDLFWRPYQGLMRDPNGGDATTGIVAYRNEHLAALAAHPDLGNQPARVYAAPFAEPGHSEPPGFQRLMAHSLFTMHPPVHGPARQLVSRRLTTKSMARYRPAAAEMVRNLIDEAVQRGELDFRWDFTVHLMADFWAHLLGWTQDESRRICELATRWSLANILHPHPDQVVAVNRASHDLLELLTATLKRERRSRDNELLTELTKAYDAMEDDAAGRPEVLESVFGVSLLDGLHSLGAEIANVVHALLASERHLATVRADASLVTSAFYEGARLHPAVTLTRRFALRDFQFAGVLIPAGTDVTMVWLLGNRDPTVFEEPNHYELHRPIRPQMTFGGGFYICPGRNVVKMLSEAVLSGLTQGDVEIRPAGPVEWTPNTGVHELEAMPVTIRRYIRGARAMAPAHDAGSRQLGRGAQEPTMEEEDMADFEGGVKHV